jgi:hypothetical protein
MPEKEKGYTFGTCSYDRTMPTKASLSPETRAINVIVPFEEALKLNLAVDQCVRKLNSYKMSTKEGKRAALNLTIYLDMNRIAVNEGKLKRD